MTLYLETSALLQLLVGEPDYAFIQSSVDGADPVVTSALTFVETRRALLRLVNEKKISSAQQKSLSGVLRRNMMSWMVMEISSDVRERAAEPFPVEPVRSLDAIHLASALEFMEAFPDLEVLSRDQRIIDNLQPLGLILHSKS